MKLRKQIIRKINRQLGSKYLNKILSHIKK